jgi:hypothetical protein
MQIQFRLHIWLSDIELFETSLMMNILQFFLIFFAWIYEVLVYF